MSGLKGLPIGLMVLFTLDWFCSHSSKTTGAPIASTPGPRHGRWRNRNGVAETKEEMSQYLARFGHLRRSRSRDPSDTELRSAIKSFQRIAGLKRTGDLDEATQEKMLQPRCGISDQPLTGRKKRYSLSGSLWPKTNINYRFQSFTAKIKPRDLIDTFASAFAIWSAVVPVTFTQTYSASQADLEILFASGDHSDGFPFDGPGGILAHTFAPTDGRMHFDESEDWNTGSDTGSDSGIYIRQVAAHEAGHAIGLGHSIMPGSLMSPFYPGYEPNVQLSDDDIDAIQLLYGIPDNYKPSNENNPTSSSTSSSSSSTTTSTTTTTTTTTTKPSSIILPTTTTSTTTLSSSSSSSSPPSTTIVQKLLMTRFTPATRRMTPVKPNVS